MDEFFYEKTQLVAQHHEEKEKIKSLYELTLLNKEDVYNRKLDFLENEINRLKIDF